MERCETCAHWGAPDEREKDCPVRRCMVVPHDPNGVVDYNPDDWEWMKESDPEGYAEATRQHEAIAVVVDGSGYRAALRTRAAFGCVLHALREAGQ